MKQKGGKDEKEEQCSETETESIELKGADFPQSDFLNRESASPDNCRGEEIHLAFEPCRHGDQLKEIKKGWLENGCFFVDTELLCQR